MASGIGIKHNVDSVGVIKKDAELVAESIHRIINTRPFENPRNPMGCRIKEVLFEPNDYIAATLGAYYVNEALAKYEPRAIIEHIQVVTSRNNNKLQIKVVFRLASNPQQLFFTTVNTDLG